MRCRIATGSYAPLATTDFVGLATAPITILGSRDFGGLRDDAPVDEPTQPKRGDDA